LGNFQTVIFTSPSRSDRGEDRPKPRTWITDRANALVWRLPAPRRARVLLSQLVYRNPPISTDRVLEVLQTLERQSVRTVLIGGWGIDALVGRQLRPHRDVDVLVDEGQLELAAAVLGRIGFESWNADHEPGPIGELTIACAITLRDRALRVVELHAVDLGEVNPVGGTIGGRQVRCLSANHQLQAQRKIGRTWTPQRRLNQQRNLAAVQKLLQSD
jgi:hypothetical protein